MKKAYALIVASALATAACTELPEHSSDTRTERIYRTGSNVPVHERTGSGKVLSLDSDGAQDLVRRTQLQGSPSPSKASP